VRGLTTHTPHTRSPNVVSGRSGPKNPLAMAAPPPPGYPTPHKGHEQPAPYPGEAPQHQQGYGGAPPPGYGGAPPTGYPPQPYGQQAPQGYAGG
jgi:hypothetical protein